MNNFGPQETRQPSARRPGRSVLITATAELVCAFGDPSGQFPTSLSLSLLPLPATPVFLPQHNFHRVHIPSTSVLWNVSGRCTPAFSSNSLENHPPPPFTIDPIYLVDWLVTGYKSFPPSEVSAARFPISRRAAIPIFQTCESSQSGRISGRGNSPRFALRFVSFLSLPLERFVEMFQGVVVLRRFLHVVEM